MRSLAGGLILATVMAAQTAYPAMPPATSFGIAVRQYGSRIPTLAAASQISVAISIGHKGAEPLELEFPSGQLYDIFIYNDRGERIYTWSADKLFPAVLTRVQLRERRVYTEDLPLPLNPGRYVVEAFLTTSGGPLYRATMPVEIKAR